ncbi:MAG: hypothetical protein HY738_07175, partial [Bacteroidia bacterium]|nr:hypothetical protein [Bacteroidia bacterium]
NNIFIGNGSGSDNTTGSNNISIGKDAGSGNQTGNGNIFLGYQAGYNEAGSNKLYIENSNADATNALIYGEFGNDVIRFNASVGIGTYPAYKLHVLGSTPDDASFQGLGYFVNNVTNDDDCGIYASTKSTDFYGYGGYFEGGYMGVKGKVTSIGTNSYRGVYGEASGTGTKYGVYGSASGSGTNYGVYGSASGGTTNYAGYFNGNVSVTGTLSKGGGSFKIDHPLDPENKLLYHSFVESPDMKNIYDGIAVLDENGKALIQLPAYFEALNKDFRYMFAPIGAPMPNLFIEQEIVNNQFIIAGGVPGMKISWQVTGIRKDPFAEHNRIQVEVEKTQEEKGYYLYPEVYSLPVSKGIDFKIQRQK